MECIYSETVIWQFPQSAIIIIIIIIITIIIITIITIEMRH